MFSYAEFAVTQSIPQMTCDQVPLPYRSRTLTAYMVVPGATPITPLPLFLAAIVPATCVPWPLSSLAFGLPLTQLVPSTTLRSGWVRATPVSITATLTSLGV